MEMTDTRLFQDGSGICMRFILCMIFFISVAFFPLLSSPIFLFCTLDELTST